MQSFKEYLAEAKLPHDVHMLSYAYADFGKEFLDEFDQIYGTATSMWLDDGDNDYTTLRQVIMRGDEIKISHRVMTSRRLRANRDWNFLCVDGDEDPSGDDEEFEAIYFKKAAKPFDDPKFKSFEYSSLTSIPSGLAPVMHALNLAGNQITGGFEHLPNHVDLLNLSSNKIRSLSGLGHNKRSFFQLDLSNNPIESNILSLLKCEFINELIYDPVPPQAKKALTILEKHLKSRDVIGCQRELIENDLDDFAEL